MVPVTLFRVTIGKEKKLNDIIDHGDFIVCVDRVIYKNFANVRFFFVSGLGSEAINNILIIY